MNLDKSKNILTEKIDSNTLRLKLDDPQRRNALSSQMIARMISALERAEINKEVKVIIIAATNPVFCAGHDLKEMTAARNKSDNGQAFFQQLFDDCSRLMQMITNHSKPIIAEVSGVATAAGCQLVASCDLAVASEKATFATPGVHIGLFCSTPMVALSRNISNKHAMEMLLTGEMVDAKKAVSIGLINKVTSESNLKKQTQNLANLIAGKPTLTVSIGKKTFYEQKNLSLNDAYALCSKVMTMNMLKEEAKEGIEAFLDKREPNWDLEND